MQKVESESVALNIAERAQQVSPPMARKHDRIARASAAECAAGLDLMEVYRVRGVDDGRCLVHRVGAMLRRMAWWAEQQVWVCDQFRDGNVPAAFEVKGFIQRAFASLPGSVRELRLRGDSALYDEAALTWADDQGIQFAPFRPLGPAIDRPNAPDPGLRNPRAENHPTMWVLGSTPPDAV